MKRFRIYDFVLGSSIELPELIEEDIRMPSHVFTVASSPPDRMPPLHWVRHVNRADGTVWLSVARVGKDHLLRFESVADFVVSQDGRNIRCTPVATTAAETLRHLLLDQVMPLVLSLGPQLVLHASALATADGALAFVGESGRGKSTLVASFAAHNMPLLTDDCLLLRPAPVGFLAVPSYPSLRLWRDVVADVVEPGVPLFPIAGYTDKLRLNARGKQPAVTPLRAVFVLAPQPTDRSGDDTVSITPLSPRTAFSELLTHLHRLDTDDRDTTAVGFDLLGHLATVVPVHRLTFAHDLSQLPTVRAAVLSTVAPLARAAC